MSYNGLVLNDTKNLSLRVKRGNLDPSRGELISQTLVFLSTTGLKPCEGAFSTGIEIPSYPCQQDLS